MNPSIEDLKGMLARRDLFFASLLHELRTPLAPIANAVEVLAKCGDDRVTVSNARGVIQRQVRQLARLVDDLADVGQIVRGRVTLRRETIDLADVVATAVEAARSLIEVQRHRLTVEVPSGQLIVQADPVRLAQVMSNLLINAAKYTRPGGYIGIYGEKLESAVMLRVRDNGIGIEPAMLRRIFEPFTQAAPRFHGAQGGLGMGLAIARQLIELHGGFISAHSEGPNRGSEFALMLPKRLGQRPIGASDANGRR